VRNMLLLLATFLLSMCSSEASDPEPSARLFVTYPVKELPVWSEGGEFDPRILIEFLHSAVANSETTDKSQIKITPSKTSAALIVLANVETQGQVWDILARIRGREADSRPDFQKLLRSQQADAIHQNNDAIHQNKMNTRMYRMEREQLERRWRLSLLDQPSLIP